MTRRACWSPWCSWWPPAAAVRPTPLDDVRLHPSSARRHRCARDGRDADCRRRDHDDTVDRTTEAMGAVRAAATSPALDTLVAWYVGEPVEFAPTDVVFQVPPFFDGVEVLTPDVVARAQAAGFEVWVWMDDTATQETAEFYRAMLDRGVDGLLVSRPAVAVGVVEG